MNDPIDALATDARAAEVLGLSAATTPPSGLRRQVLEAALTSRPAGEPAGSTEAITAVESFRRALAGMAVLLDSLSDADAACTTIEGWTVAGLLGHLNAIDEHFGATLGWWPAVGELDLEHDHLAMTLPAVAIAQERPFAEVRAQWHATAGRVEALLDGLDARSTARVLFHGFNFSIRSLLIARTFEIWTHSEDIGRAIGRAPQRPGIAQLRLMSSAAVGALPIGMLLTGAEPAGRSVRIVLTGDGGGAWLQPLELGGTTTEPTLTIVADAIEFCRVAAKRRAPADLACDVIGEVDLALDVLTAAAIFAA